MLLANYLVAQRLLTHAKHLALLRLHPEPLEDGLDKVAAIAKAAIGFDMDISSSQALHRSLVDLSRQCENDPLVLQCVTQMLMTPMQPADYFCVGTKEESDSWRHFALNIPYYTHFTSPIRRYADVLVHRLLQATIDGTVDKFYLDSRQLQLAAEHCNEKRMDSKTAQERCDRVFLALCVRSRPMENELGIVVSMGVTSFTVFVPSIGAGVLLYLEEHKHMLTWESSEDNDSGSRSILLKQSKTKPNVPAWGELEIRIFSKLMVTVACKEKPPIDVKLQLQGPWP